MPNRNFMRTLGTPEKTTLKILVAGGSGFIGNGLISRLTEKDPIDGKQQKQIF
jgi:nucleoside-diphosphate-sugar epimerase